YPALRHTSRFAMIASRPLWKRSLTRALATAPISVEPLLRPLTWALAKFRTVPAFRRAALRLFQVQQNIAAYRSAVKEAGSWQAIPREFGARRPILMYHGIGPMRDGTDPFLTISPQMFESQLQWLSRNGF